MEGRRGSSKAARGAERRADDSRSWGPSELGAGEALTSRSGPGSGPLGRGRRGRRSRTHGQWVPADLPLWRPGEAWIAAGPPNSLAGAPAPGPPRSSAPWGLRLRFLRRPDFTSLAAAATAAANPEAAALEAACAKTPDHVAHGATPGGAGRGGAGPEVPGGAARGVQTGLVFAGNWGRWEGMALSLCNSVSFMSPWTRKLTLRSRMCD